MKINDSSVDCNDEGAFYKEDRANIALSQFLSSQRLVDGDHVVQEFISVESYSSLKSPEEHAMIMMGVQVTKFRCGGVAIGLCLRQKVADAGGLALFLFTWTAGLHGEMISSLLNAGSLFPPKGNKDFVLPGYLILSNDNTVTKRFEFNARNLASLRAKKMAGCSPARVQAVTALVQKRAMEAAAKAKSAKRTSLPPPALGHIVDVKDRMNPPLPLTYPGNPWLYTVTPPVSKLAKEVKLKDLTGLLRSSTERIDGDLLGKLQAGDDDRLAMVMEPLHAHLTASRGELQLYRFTRRARIPLHDVDFGWENQARVRTIGLPEKNQFLLKGIKSGDGTAAWVTRTERGNAPL